eukprot:1350329-Amphidinium_carterae.1
MLSVGETRLWMASCGEKTSSIQGLLSNQLVCLVIAELVCLEDLAHWMLLWSTPRGIVMQSQDVGGSA